jgi:hypothetical protein
MKTYALDATCFIDAALNPPSLTKDALQTIFQAAEQGRIALMVSLHTLHELEDKKDAASELARRLPSLPHYPISTWDEQVARWDEIAGTWNDARENQERQFVLKELANSGTSIRDRGAYIDAYCSRLDGFVTSDSALVKGGPSSRINTQFATKVMRPEELAKSLDLDSKAQAEEPR